MKYYEVNFRIDAPEAMMQTARDILPALAVAAGFETFEDTAVGVKGFVQQQLFSQEALDALLSDFPLPQTAVSYTFAEADYRDWNEQWEQQGFEPIAVGPFVIHDGRHLPASVPPETCAIEIHARQAFGTGTHETTRMMVATIAEAQLTGKRVLDCGTGTGILAIAALKAGASEAVGYDIDEWSTDNACHNAALNGVDAHFKVLLGDASVLDGIEGTFDMVLANINRNILLADMPAMAARLKADGILVVSGFLTEDAGLLVSKAQTLALQPCEKRQETGWMCLSFSPR